MSTAALILLLVTLQRLGELALAHRNTRRLLQMGAVEIGAVHYPALVAIHAGWLLSLWVWGAGQPVDAMALALFILLQGVRVWVLATLGERWTTRIIVLPGAPLVTTGPYRYLSHPNYVVVAGEIALLPLALHLPWIAAIFTVLNAAILSVRIRAESAALAAASGSTVS